LFELLPAERMLGLASRLCCQSRHIATCEAFLFVCVRPTPISELPKFIVGPRRKEVSRFKEGLNDFIESVDDMCIHYDGRRVAANGSLIAEISKGGLRNMAKQTHLDRKTIRAVLNGKKVKTSTLAKVVMGLRGERVAKKR
jgi:hypothetical protein